MLDHAPIGIFISTPGGRFLSANSAMAEMYGYASAEDIVHAVNDISTQIYVDPDARRRLFRILASQDAVTGYEAVHRRKNGAMFWTSESVHAVRDPDGTIRCLQGFVVDISARKTAEQAARDSEEHFRAMFQNAPAPYQSLDADGNFLDVNQAFLDVLGYRRSELIGRNFATILTPEGVALFAGAFPRFKALGEVHDVEFELVKKDGATIFASFRGRIQRDARGRFQRTLCVFQDISLARRIEKALRAAAECASVLSGSEDVSDRLDRVVDVLQMVTGFSRAYIFQNEEVSGVGLCMSQIHEACGPGIKAQLGNPDLQRLGYQEGAPQLFEALTRKQPYTRSVADLSGLEREVLEAQGIKAILILPIYAGDVFWGFLGLDDCINDRRWREDELSLLQTVANAIGLAIQRDDYEKALEEHQAKLSLAMELSDMAPWEMDVATGTFTFDDRFYALYGTTAGREGGPLMSAQTYAREFVHPEDAWRVADEVRKTLASDAPRYEGQLEHRILRREGEVRHIVVRYRLIRDEMGRPVKTIGANQDITERKRMEEALRESELRFKALHNASFGGITIHDKGVILDCNQGLSEISGYAQEELVGMDGLLLIAERSRGEVMQHILAGREKPYEAYGVRKNGEEYPLRLEARNIPYKGRMVRTVEFRDITEHKRAEEALKANELRFRTLLDDVDMVAVQGYDQDRRVIYWNKASQRLYGYAEAEALGRNLEDLIIPGPLREAVIQGVRDWLDNGTPIAAGELELVRKDGAAVPVYSSHVMQETASGKKEMYCIDVDLTEIKKAHDQLLQAKEAAESANRAKSEFLANMSHEIRTPLNGVMGMLQILKDTELDGEQHQFIDLALESSRRLTRLLSDILDLSRVEAGKLQMQAEVMDFAGVVRQLAALHEPVSLQTGVRFEVALHPALPGAVVGDSIRLQQVLTNLIGNAFKFTTSGSVVLEACPLPGRRPGEAMVLFTVSDTGCGMDDGILEKLFEPFVQASQGATRRYQGAGLGLSIVKRIVELMGGTLAVESEPGAGTTFFVAIPFVQTPEGMAVEHEGARIQSASAQGGLRILVAEDDIVSSLAITRQLVKRGHGVHVARDGRQALDALRKTAFDLVLMDVQMPVMDGVAATRRIRAGEVGKARSKTPIIAMTAFAKAGDRETFLAAGMDDYVAKPVDNADLDAAIARLQERRVRRNAGR
ncbi:MAG: PAS domain S-box protein [Desulfovibrionaceae bacterium]|nr:PAS domain S-box protein [Desulfovibrionaceae bacterium]